MRGELSILGLTEAFPSIVQRVLGLRGLRMGDSKDASIPPCDVLEDRHSFGVISLVAEDKRVPPAHPKDVVIVRSKCLQSSPSARQRRRKTSSVFEEVVAGLRGATPSHAVASTTSRRSFFPRRARAGTRDREQKTIRLATGHPPTSASASRLYVTQVR